MEKELNFAGLILTVFIVILVIVILIGSMMYIFPVYGRYQKVQNAKNEIQVNEMLIQQTAQLVNVEKQKAEIKVAEANGIAAAQKIINETLTDRYLQHEAIMAQEKMSYSPNHTTIYIPSGNNGIPIVNTIDPTK